MRTLLVVVFMAIAAIVGHSLGAGTTHAQMDNWLAFQMGETVRLSVDLPEGAISCRVSQVQNGFIGCTRDEQHRQSARWINLRFVREITPQRER